MTFEAASRGRGGLPRGRGRGFGGDRGGGRGFSRGFRGGDTRGRGGGGRGRGDRGGRGSFRGGDRGAFRGDRGSFRGAPRGAFRGGNRDFNGSSMGGLSHGDRPVCHETAHGLQLRICYKSDIPTEEEVSNQLPGFHSRFQKSEDKDGYHVLFKDIESLEAAKIKLENDDAVTSVDYVGLKSAKYQPLSKENRQLFLQFKSEQDEEAVKQLDNGIVSVEFLKDKLSCLAEFPTAEEAKAYLKKASLIKDHVTLAFCRVSYATKTNNFAKASIVPDQVVVRDVPKKATLKDLALLFPDANSVTLYDKTFPSSDYCHAAFRFEDADRVKTILAQDKNNKILGKKVYVSPAYMCLLADMPKLGQTWTGDKAAAESPVATNAKDSNESPKKKIKLDEEVNGDEEEEDDNEGEDEEDDNEGEDEEDDEEGEDEEDDEEENGKADNEDEMESAAEEDDDEEEESDD